MLAIHRQAGYNKSSLFASKMEMEKNVHLMRKKDQQGWVCAVIPAAGSSTRMGGLNKMLLELDGQPILVRTAAVFQQCAAVNEIVLVCREQDILPYGKLMKQYGFDKVRTIVCGGDTRSASVLAGICACPENTTLVAVHDGARPLVTQEIITEAVNAAAEYGAAAPTVPVKDSIKRVENGEIVADVARDTLAAVQTPQVFRREMLENALRQAMQSGRSFTDDCAAVEAFGVTVRATAGSYENMKVTTPEDIIMGEAILQNREENSI